MGSTSKRTQVLMICQPSVSGVAKANRYVPLIRIPDETSGPREDLQCCEPKRLAAEVTDVDII